MVDKDLRTDEQVVRQFIAGDESAFDELVHRYYRQVYAFLTRFVGRADAAEDLTQEIFIKVHQSVATFDTTRKFKPWLFAIAANKARDAFRASGRRVKTVSIQQGRNEEDQTLSDILPGQEELPADEMIRREMGERVRQAVDRLPENLKEVILLAYYQQLQYKEISEILDIPLGTVKSRVHKAVQMFASIWKSEDHE